MRWTLQAKRERLVAKLGATARALILRNQGLVTLGRTVPEAFILMDNLERAGKVQMAIQASGQAINPMPAEVCERTMLQYDIDVSERRKAPRWLHGSQPA